MSCSYFMALTMLPVHFVTFNFFLVTSTVFEIKFQILFSVDQGKKKKYLYSVNMNIDHKVSRTLFFVRSLLVSMPVIDQM